MIVFKTFLKVLKACIVPIIMYTVFLIGFGGFNLKTSDTSTNFISSKPNILIINEDVNEGVTKNLVEYIQNNSNQVEIGDNKEAIDDALFYRDVNYIIYIPKNYRENFLKGKNPQIEVKSTGDYQASLAELILSRYIQIANSYNSIYSSEEEIIEKINDTLSKETEVEVTSTLDTNTLSKATFYYNFASYSLLAGCVYVICLILSSFKSEKIKKRTIISSTNYKEFNRKLLLANGLFALILWIFYVLLSVVLLGNIMFTTHGLIYVVNSFIFTFCTLTIAFLIGNIINDKNAINGIVNVIALGSSFLCGAFVPMQWLPDSVLKIAHILPSYYYISTNEILVNLEIINFETLKTILINMVAILLFSFGFIIITNIISKRKQKIG